MLHSHPRIGIPPETRFALATYKRRLSFGDLEKRQNRMKVAKFIVGKGNRFRDLGLDRDETKQLIVNAPPTIGSLIGTVFHTYAERFDRPRWGDKWPAYHRYLEIVMRLFPDAQVIHLVRDPRDCAASLKRMPWWKRSIYASLSTWSQAVDHTDEAMRRWPGSIIRVQYEQLVAEPEQELRRLAAWLGEEYDPAMAEPQRLAPVAVPERKHWHSNTRISPSTASVGRWREDLEPWEVAICERVLGGRMARFGYEPSSRALPLPHHIARYYYLNLTRKAARRRWLAKDREKRLKEKNPVAAQLTSGQRELTYR